MENPTQIASPSSGITVHWSATMMKAILAAMAALIFVFGAMGYVASTVDVNGENMFEFGWQVPKDLPRGFDAKKTARCVKRQPMKCIFSCAGRTPGPVCSRFNE